MKRLESVDTLIKRNQDLQGDILWDEPGPFEPVTQKLLDRISGDLEYLHRLREDGVVYEPMF